MSSSHRRCLVIEDKTWKDIKAFIMLKTGDIKKGDISKWANIAFDNLLRGKVEEEIVTNTHTQKGSKALELRNRIIEWLKINYRYGDLHDVNVPRKHLTQAITAVEDKTDKRTINSRIDLLMSNKYIEEYENPEELENKNRVKKYRFKISEEELKKEETQT